MGGGEVQLVSVLGSASVCTVLQIKRSRHTLTVLIRGRARGEERVDSEVSETEEEMGLNQNMYLHMKKNVVNFPLK